MHSESFLQDLAVVMTAAGVAAVLCRRFRQPVVLGYLLAGFVIGPHTPPFPLIQDQRTIRTLAELGIVFLMFSLGLDFSFRKLRAVGTTALIAATLEILLMVWIGYEIGRVFGWSPMDRLFLGAMLSISSTTIVVKALQERKQSDEPFAALIFGILVVEDVLAVVMIALLSSIAMTGTLETGAILATVLRMTVFLVVSLLVGLLAVPRLLDALHRFKSDELLLVSVLGLCFGISLLAVALGYSAALGAFVIGAVIAEARAIGRIRALTEPVRDLFSAVFFVSMGLLIDPALLAAYAVPIALITAAVVAGKVATCAFGTFIAGHGPRTSLQVGMGLAQIGEFSFIIAALGSSLAVTSPFLYPIAVSVSVVTTFLTPYLIRSAAPFSALLERAVPPPVAAHLTLYTRWIRNLGEGHRDNPIHKHLRRVALQLFLNAMLIAGVFLGAAFLVERRPGWLPAVPEAWGGTHTIAWLSAMLATSPVYVAILRKLQALAMLFSEMAVPVSRAGARTTAVRAVVSHTILGAGLAATGLFTLLLSSAILPPWKVGVALALALTAGTVLSWNAFVKLYARAQIALAETFAEPPPVPPPPAAVSLLTHATLETVLIPPGGGGAGKLIRELNLRAETGASIVAIERADAESLVNPGPDEELLPGDRVLVLGEARHRAAAHRLLTEKPPTA